MSFTRALLRVCLLCFFSGLHVFTCGSLFFLSVWFLSLRFSALNEFVFVYYYICIFLKHCFCLARVNARLLLFFSILGISFLTQFLFLLVLPFGAAVALACLYEIFAISSSLGSIGLNGLVFLPFLHGLRTFFDLFLLF